MGNKVKQVLGMDQAKEVATASNEVQSTGHSEDADLNPIVYDGKLLACERVDVDGQKHRFIIQDKDKLFVEYKYAQSRVLYSGIRKPSEINCKAFTTPPKPTSMLRSLPGNLPILPEDAIGLIAANLNHEVHYDECHLSSFNMTLLERCRAALTGDQWERVQREVKVEGGSCTDYYPLMILKAPTLQTCMTSPVANQVAVCHVSSDGDDLEIIKQKERYIEAALDAIQSRRRSGRWAIHDHRSRSGVASQAIKKERIEQTRLRQEHTKLIQKKIKAAQRVIDMRKQNMFYLPQIFEGL